MNLPDYFWLIAVSGVLGAAVGLGLFAWLQRQAEGAISKVGNPLAETALKVASRAVFVAVDDQIENLRQRVRAAQAPDSDGGTAITDAEAKEIADSVLPTAWGSLSSEIKNAFTGAHASEEAAKETLRLEALAVTRQRIREEALDLGEASDPLAVSGQLKPASEHGSL